MLVAEKDSMSFTGFPNIVAWMTVNPQSIFQIPLCPHQTFNWKHLNQTHPIIAFIVVLRTGCLFSFFNVRTCSILRLGTDLRRSSLSLRKRVDVWMYWWCKLVLSLWSACTSAGDAAQWTAPGTWLSRSVNQSLAFTPGLLCAIAESFAGLKWEVMSRKEKTGLPNAFNCSLWFIPVLFHLSCRSPWTNRIVVQTVWDPQSQTDFFFFFF